MGCGYVGAADVCGVTGGCRVQFVACRGGDLQRTGHLRVGTADAARRIRGHAPQRAGEAEEVLGVGVVIAHLPRGRVHGVRAAQGRRTAVHDQHLLLDVCPRLQGAPALPAWQPCSAAVSRLYEYPTPAAAGTPCRLVCWQTSFCLRDSARGGMVSLRLRAGLHRLPAGHPAAAGAHQGPAEASTHSSLHAYDTPRTPQISTHRSSGPRRRLGPHSVTQHESRYAPLPQGHGRPPRSPALWQI